MAKKKQNETVTFIAKCHNLRLTLRPAYGAIRAPNGNVITPADAGEHVQFESHEFKTDDPKVVEALRDYEGYNLYFWEDGKAPNEPQPRTKDQLEAIIKAQAVLDADAINAVLKVERETHNRPLVIDTAEAALDAIDVDGENESSRPTSDNSEPVLTTSRD